MAVVVNAAGDLAAGDASDAPRNLEAANGKRGVLSSATVSGGFLDVNGGGGGGRTCCQADGGDAVTRTVRSGAHRSPQ